MRACELEGGRVIYRKGTHPEAEMQQGRARETHWASGRTGNSELCLEVGECETKPEKIGKLRWSQSADASLRSKTGELRPPDATP